MGNQWKGKTCAMCSDLFIKITLAIEGRRAGEGQVWAGPIEAQAKGDSNSLHCNDDTGAVWFGANDSPFQNFGLRNYMI